MPIRDVGIEVSQAFVMTTPEQRRAVAEDYNHPNRHRSLAIEYANLLHISPDGLLIAALLDTEDAVVCHPGGRPKDKSFEALLKMALAHKPVHNQGETVDNLWTNA